MSMKIAILIRNYNYDNYENLKFRQVASKMGISLSILSTEDLSIISSNREIKVYKNQSVLPHFDFLITRLGCSFSLEDELLLNAFASLGTKLVNNAAQINTMKNKYLLNQTLIANNVPVIKTMLTKQVSDIDLIEREFSYPLVFKSNNGSLGMGVYLVNNRNELQNLMEHSLLLDKSYTFMIQEFVNTKIGEDIRVWVYKGEILGLMHRKSIDDSFKANYTIHNNAVSYQVDTKLEKIVNSIYEALQCDIAGVDLLFDGDDYVVCEVNSAPGFKGMDQVNPGINIPKTIFKDLKNEYRQTKEK